MPPYSEDAFCMCGLFQELSLNEKAPIPLPLKEVNVSSKVVDFVAQVQIEQKYKNESPHHIQAIYVFPLHHEAVVHKFEADIDGRQLVGVVKEKEEACAEYDAALKSGRSAVMLEQLMTEIFKARVGNIPPGKEAVITLAYYSELPPEESAVRFYIPTTIAPRYRPAADASNNSRDIANIPYVGFSTAPLKIDVTFEMKSRITKILSPTHEIVTSVEKDENTHKMYGGKASLAGETTHMNKDFVVLIHTEDPHAPRVCLETSCDEESSTAAMLTIVPRFQLKDQKVELIFVIDRSGSMHGKSINRAKDALTLFLHSLPVDCYINIVGFGTTHCALFMDGSQKYNDTVLRTCLSHAYTLDANLGSTEILRPLQDVLSWKPIEGYIRQVFVLTDGQVTNTKDVIQFVRQNVHMSRVFALGIGNSASHELVHGISKAGNGTAEFVTYEEDFQWKVMKQLKRALQPALTKVSVKWGDMEVKPPLAEVITEKTLLGYGLPKVTPQQNIIKQAPFKIPPVFSGTRTLVYCILEKENIPKEVTLIAESPDGPLSVSLNVCEEEIYKGNIIHRMAAKKLIDDLECDISSLGTLSKEESRNEIINLGCKYGILSTYTSFVAVDKGSNKQAGQEYAISTVEIPSPYPVFRNTWRYFDNFGAKAKPQFTFGAPSALPSSGFQSLYNLHSGSSFGAPSASPRSEFQSSRNLHSGSSFGAPSASPWSEFQSPYNLHSGSSFEAPSASPFSEFESPYNLHSGSSFGASNPQQTRGFGSTANKLNASTFGSTASGCGATTGSGSFTFGAPATSKSSVFGATVTESSVPSFGAAKTQCSGFGSTASTASGFGSTAGYGGFTFGAATTQSSGFGSTANTPSAFTFGSTASTASGFGGFTFGTPATPLSSGFRSTGNKCSAFTFGSSTVSPACGFGAFAKTESVEAVSNNDESSILGAIINLQKYDGQFHLDPLLASLLGIEVERLKEGAIHENIQENIWATAIAIMYLEVKLPKKKELWELIAEKGKKWMQSTGDHEAVLYKADMFVKKCLNDSCSKTG